MQGPGFVRTTIKSQVLHASTETLYDRSHGTIVSRLSLVYKVRRWPPGRGDHIITQQHTLSRSRPHSTDIGILLNYLAGTWRLPLLSRLACSPLYEHHGALQYSATSANLLYVWPTVGTRINLVSLHCLAPASASY
jgi:hypothetical protein